jgi:UDP-N-acetylglucosamine 4-epimerase
MVAYNKLLSLVGENSKKWLITGVAGFIGSNLLEFLLSNNQNVIGVDNLFTGSKKNLEDIKTSVSQLQWSKFQFIESDIRDIKKCRSACEGVDVVLHHAAIGSVQRSLEDPITTHAVNVSGFLNMLVAAKEAKVAKFIYASSSSVYGDIATPEKVEEIIGKPLSPYACNKRINEIYADIFNQAYGLECTGLRYFNVFGKRQDPLGMYAAVMPRWISAMINNSEVIINGDGGISRDFCYIENVIQANMLAALIESDSLSGEPRIYNVAVGGNTTLNELFELLLKTMQLNAIDYRKTPKYVNVRAGDIMHSRADISKIKKNLGYMPSYDLQNDIAKTVSWYLDKKYE